MQVVPRTSVASYAKLLSANSTASSFASVASTTTDPSSNSGFLTLCPPAGPVPNSIILMPFGAGSDDQTFDMRVIGWLPFGSPYSYWVPTILWQGTCTLSTAVGVAGQTTVATDRYADTIDTDIGTDGVTCSRLSNAANQPASVLVDLRGHRLIQIDFDMTGATNGNCLYSPVSP